MRLQRLTRIAVLSAMAYVLILFEFAVPFLFPTYLKYDFSEVPGLMAAFTMGPIAGLAVEAVKDLLKLAINPGDGGLIGMVANFVAGGTLVYAAGLVRKALGDSNRSLVKDIAALVTGTLTMTVVMLVVNGFVIFPVYYHVPAQAVWQMSFALTTPFNLMKGAVSCVAAVLLYRPLESTLRSGSLAEHSVQG